VPTMLLPGLAGERTVLRAVVLLLVSLFVLTGCGQASSPVEREEKQHGLDDEANTPAYNVTLDEEGTGMGLRLRNVSASTDATSREGLEAITRDLWAQGSEVDAMIVTFYPNEQTADPVGTGEAYRSEQTARTVISAMYTDPSEANVNEQVREAMANEGFRVVSLEEEVENMNREVCAEWDVTTMGTPPPEMDCPGY
jgi:hypothetical protein